MNMACKLGDQCRCVSEPGLCPNWEDRKHTNWRLGAIDRRRHVLQSELADLDRQEREVLGIQPK